MLGDHTFGRAAMSVPAAMALAIVWIRTRPYTQFGTQGLVVVSKWVMTSRSFLSSRRGARRSCSQMPVDLWTLASQCKRQDLRLMIGAFSIDSGLVNGGGTEFVGLQHPGSRANQLLHLVDAGLGAMILLEPGYSIFYPWKAPPRASTLIALGTTP